MKTKTYSFAFALFFGLFCSSHAQMMHSIQNPEIKHQIDSVFTEMLSLAENFDYDGLDSGVDDRYKAGFISNGTYYTDYASLIQFVKLRAQGVSEQQLKISHKKITILSDKHVLLNATGVAKIILDDGRVVTNDFYWSFLFEQFNASWKVIHSHQSSGK